MNLNNGRLSDISDLLWTFNGHFEELNEQLEVLNVEARELEDQISENIVKILEVK